MDGVNEQNMVLYRLFESQDVSLYMCIANLLKHADSVGIFSYLCNKIKTFKYEEVEFYVPQLCQIVVTVETECMALEDLLIEYSSQYPHFILLTFWQFQSYLTDFSDDPESYGFQVSRRMLNTLQFYLFNAGSTPIKKFRENTQPAIVLSSVIAASLALPQLGEYVAPLAISQGRKQRSFVFQLAKNYSQQLKKNLTLKNTRLNSLRDTSGASMVSNSDKYDTIPSPTADDKYFKKDHPHEDESEVVVESLQKIMDNTDVFAKKRNSSKKSGKLTSQSLRNYPSSIASAYKIEDFDLSTSRINLSDHGSSASLPAYNDNYSDYDNHSIPSSPSSSNGIPALYTSRSRTNSMGAVNNSEGGPSNNNSRGRNASHNQSHHHKRTISPSLMTTTTKIRLLKSNYFKCETQFAIALQQISLRLSQVPKEARLSTLKAEISLLNRDLPAEVDIPTLLPAAKKMKLHKIVRITPNEAAVLNSAEKVPFLLLIEYFSDEVDFDPISDSNMKLLRERADKKYIFDLGTHTATRLVNEAQNEKQKLSEEISNTPQLPFYDDSELVEEDLGDLSVVKLSNRSETETLKNELFINSASIIPDLTKSGAHDRSASLTFSSKYTPMPSPFLADSGSISEDSSGQNDTSNDPVQPEDLATHMRIAAVMLTQLDKPNNTLQLDQSAAIKARIIESMQSLQDNFGYNDIQMVKGQAGDRKLENDLKLGGLYNSSETTYLGEDWDTKKARIRNESPFGYRENWDLCSVISKTGDDLRQESFACQLIQAMAQIWKNDNVGVWVKKMRILITSANTGLVETITNALSVHSIKKALTKITIEEGSNPKGTIESLPLHFKKVFGEPESPKYRNAQKNFAASLAAYSLICYLLQVKDRHNGNIMLDNEGHIIHIDFGFMLSNSPGSVGFEAAPFKLPFEYIDVLGGLESEQYAYFKKLLKEAFLSIRKHAEDIVQMVGLMQRDSMQPCFKAGDQTAYQLRQRFQLHLSDSESEDFVENFLIQKSIGSLYTRLYDQFQLLTQGIYS